MKRISKLLSILLVVFLLTGCGLESGLESDSEYLNQLKNYEVREKNSTLDDNAEFDTYLDTIFDELVSDNYLYMHFNVADYKAMGIEKPEVGFGHIVYGVDEEEFNKTEKQLEALVSPTMQTRECSVELVGDRLLLTFIYIGGKSYREDCDNS